MKEYDGKLFWERLMNVTNHAKQKEISDTIGVSEAIISKWHNKPDIKPSVPNLITISEKYNCSIDYLLGVDVKENTDTLSVTDACRLMIRLRDRFDGTIESHCESDGFGDTVIVTLRFLSRFQSSYLYEGDEVTVRNPEHTNFESLQIALFFDKYLNLDKMEFDNETKELFTKALLDKTEQKISAWKQDEELPF